METHNGVKGTWEDVTRECAIEWNRSVSSKSSNIRIFHHCNIVGYVGGGTPQQCGDGYRVSATKGVSSLLAGEILVEHFEPAPPEYGWVDVTEECDVVLDFVGGHFIKIRHGNIQVGRMARVLHDEQKENYRVTGEEKLSSVEGSFKVEHYQEIE